jgi:hypothetical protein
LPKPDEIGLEVCQQVGVHHDGDANAFDSLAVVTNLASYRVQVRPALYGEAEFDPIASL